MARERDYHGSELFNKANEANLPKRKFKPTDPKSTKRCSVLWYKVEKQVFPNASITAFIRKFIMKPILTRNAKRHFVEI